jgi:pSer/pThr/pTyr-binding forkhead associated (FHA) protein
MPCLIVHLPDREPQTIPLNDDRYVIGREDGCDIVLPHAVVSNRHAMLMRLGDRYSLEDLNSTNGTQVNGTPQKRCELEDNDSITVGILELIFRQRDPDDKDSASIKSPKNPMTLGAEAELDF